MKKYMSRAGEFGSEEEKVGDDLSTWFQMHEMQPRNERHRVRVLRNWMRIWKIGLDRAPIFTDLLETLGRRIDLSEDEFPDLSENDLVERGRPFAFLEEDEDTNDDGDEDTNDDGDEFN